MLALVSLGVLFCFGFFSPPNSASVWLSLVMQKIVEPVHEVEDGVAQREDQAGPLVHHGARVVACLVCEDGARGSRATFAGVLAVTGWLKVGFGVCQVGEALQGWTDGGEIVVLATF